MPTTKTRVNITLPQNINHMLTLVATRDNMPKASKALQLLTLALQIQEDQIWDQIANARDTPDAEFFSHEEAWV